MKWQERIRIDPRICHGKPCIKGTRIWVSLILDLLAAGETIESVVAEYPQVTRDDVLACIAYGAEMARERFVPIPTTPAAVAEERILVTMDQDFGNVLLYPPVRTSGVATE